MLLLLPDESLHVPCLQGSCGRSRPCATARAGTCGRAGPHSRRCIPPCCMLVHPTLPCLGVLVLQTAASTSSKASMNPTLNPSNMASINPTLNPSSRACIRTGVSSLPATLFLSCCAQCFRAAPHLCGRAGKQSAQHVAPFAYHFTSFWSCTDIRRSAMRVFLI